MTLAERPAVTQSPRTTRTLATGWEAAWAPVGEDWRAEPPAGLDWVPAEVPGTAAGALLRAGRPLPPDLDETDWWFRTAFDEAPPSTDEILRLRLGGIATVASVLVNGRAVVESESMFAEHVLDAGPRLRADGNEIVIACRGLGPLLRQSRRPRARWRSRLVDDNAIRWFRTTLTGRAPGFAPGPPIVGPWRPVELVRWRGVDVADERVRARVGAGGEGMVSIGATVAPLGGRTVRRIQARLDGPNGTFLETLDVDAGSARGTIVVPGVERWWPHTHGEPTLHELTLLVEATDGAFEHPLGSVGFRTIEPGDAGHRPERDGLDLRVNGVRVFARGALWSPGPELGIRDDSRAVLERARDGGLNIVRIPGHGAYETAAFHEACDELGILVWQDLAFANLDAPFADPAFHAAAVRELDGVIGRLASHPSSVVLCGNSEVEQQVAMLGLPVELGRDPFHVETIPERLAAAECDAIAISSAPTGGDRPFRTDVGIANYYGVGGYRRPLADVRAAAVRFAAECLAFSNLPDDGGWDDEIAGGHPVVGSPSWRAGIPRDNGSSWDFEDVRDHYLAALYGVEPAELRRSDPERYLELGRLVTGEVMAEVFGEWRSAGSPSGGGLVLWLRDVLPGAGWGLFDHRGEPKPAWHAVRRIWAPVAVWTTDEGLNGIRVHAANDGPNPVDAVLRVALYRDDEVRIDGAAEAVRLAPHGELERDVEAMIGRFVDVGWTYRFGPPTVSLVAASLEAAAGDPGRPISHAFRFPVGRPAATESADRVGLRGSLRTEPDGSLAAIVTSTRYAHGVRLRVAGFAPEADAFGVEPGHERIVRLLRTAGSDVEPGPGVLSAANVRGTIPLRREVA
jgi:beta-mannosidase